MGVRLTGFRGVREGTNRQESTGIDRSRVCPCGARRTRATAQGRDRVDSGVARRATRLLSIPVDSCRFGSCFAPPRQTRLLSIPVDSRRLGTAARRLLGRPRKNSTSREIVCQVSVKPASKKTSKKKRRPQEAASLCDKMTILTSESASARYCGSPRRSGHPGDRADPSRIRRW